MITDHKSLLALLRPKKGIPPLAAACLQQWAILLSAYMYVSSGQLRSMPTLIVSRGYP